MTLAVKPRWIPPVLAVVFALLTVWASYNAWSDATASSAVGSSGPIVSYEGSGSVQCVAALSPNDLFNSTSVSCDNVTLFVPITQWINVTFVDAVVLTSTATASWVDQFAVSLSTSAWSKTIDQTVQHNTSVATTGLSVVDRYDLNVPQIESLARSINTQLNYSAASFWVRLTPLVSGSLTLANGSARFSLAPSLNITFEQPLILPTGTPASVQGALGGAVVSVDPNSRSTMAAAYVELVAAAGALLASVWLFWIGRKPTGPAALPELEKLIEPYDEVIARTTRVPETAAVLVMETWEDLVKVADTLGRPILRPAAGPSDPWGSAFYVFDGTVAYRYAYPRAVGTPSKSSAPPPTAPGRAAPASTPRAPATGGKGGTGSAVSPVPTSSRAGASTKSVTDQLEAELKRIRTSHLEAHDRWYAFSLFTQTARTVSMVGPQEAQRAVAELRHALDGILSQATRPP